MQSPPPTVSPQALGLPRMFVWALATIVLMGAALLAQEIAPGAVLSVTLYKAHLMALGGWGGYWLDRALFPYDRPHQHLEPEPLDDWPPSSDDMAGVTPCVSGMCVASSGYGQATLRRAIVVAACLVCVGLGA